MPYANSKAHVGHALEFVQGDFLSRFFRKENDVFFNLGLDEHGQKIFKAAKESGIDTQEYLDFHYQEWLKFCELFNIKYDNFYRTSDKSHHEKVSEVWKEFVNQGLIYKKKYQGQYCEGCESFKHDKDLVDGKCPDHPHLNIETINEENYFFNLKNWDITLLSWIKSNEEFLSPHSKLPELVNLIKNVEDISVSRLKSSVSWGVPVPGDEEQTIYVWFDALLNYVFSAREYWELNSAGKTIQICGPDNLRFQAVIFQGILRSLNLKYTDKLLVHGTILDEFGRKIGKSLGNTIDPVEQVEKFGIDAVRYYILSLSTFGNTNWDEKVIESLYTSHLVNDYGNLIARTLHLIDKKEVEITSPENIFKERVDSLLSDAKSSIEDNYNIHEYCTKLNELVKYGNHYINEKEPWKTDDYSITLNNLYYLLTEVTEYYSPIIPGKVESIKTALNNLKKEILFERI